MIETQLPTTLPEDFTKNGKNFELLKQLHGAYIYKVYDDEINHVYFEVFRSENVYPSNEDFGITAWCISRGDDTQKAYEIALKKFNDIIGG